MWTISRNRPNDQFERDLDRGFLRSAFLSLFWAVFSAKKKEEKLTLTQLADTLGVNKSVVSRWFSGDPNWRINTISDIANSLDIEIRVTAMDRATGRVFTPSGETTPIRFSLSVIDGQTQKDGDGVETRTPFLEERIVEIA